MDTGLGVLIVEDSDDDTRLLVRELRRGGYSPVFERVETAEAMRAALDGGGWDIVIADYALPSFSAPAALEILRESGLDLPFIVVSGKIGEDTAVEMMRAGAHDYIMKDNLTRLVPAVRRELREADHRRGRREAEEALRRSEERLRQSQKMEAVGQLAGGIAHDFNNKLGVIIGYCDILLRKLPADDASRGPLEEIRLAGREAARLTGRLLAFSHKQPIQPKVVNLNSLLWQMHDPLKRMVGEDVRVSIVSSPTLGNVLIDPTQFQQIIMNLATNARDAMPQGGELTIQTADVELDEGYARTHPGVASGPYVMVAVKDTGEGMDAGTLKHLFEPFFTTKDVGQGTGLGLSTAYGAVHQTAGSIDVSSRPGAGTTFTIYLPRTDAPAEEAAPRAAAGPLPRGSETILVVEDEVPLRKLVAETLRECGYAVMEAGNAGEAVPLGEHYEGKIDLLLTDVVLPGMSGPELAERIRASRPDVAVIFMSGYAERIAEQHGLRAIENLLNKPFGHGELAGTVRRLLDT